MSLRSLALKELDLLGYRAVLQQYWLHDPILAVSVEHRLASDRQTDRRVTTANTARHQHNVVRASKNYTLNSVVALTDSVVPAVVTSSAVNQL